MTIESDNAGDHPRPETAVLEAGMPVLGDTVGSYQLVEVIGQGGMGVVYEAEHTAIGRRVALKVLRTSRASDPRAVERFFTEARAVNTIEHPNIVEISDFVNEPDLKFTVMERLRGESLAQRMEGGGAIDVRLANRLIREIADALSAVHQAGIVHRDLKPDNVFLQGAADSPTVKLLDFGVAKLAHSDATAIRTTRDGAVIGTPQYMSPEQLAQKNVSFPTDVYSLGLVWYEMLTGNPAFSGDNYGDFLISRMTQEPTAPRSLARPGVALTEADSALLLSCLAVEPEARPSADVVSGSLLRTLNGGAAVVPPVSRSGKRVGAIAVVGIGVAALLAAAIWVISTGADSQREERRPAAAVESSAGAAARASEVKTAVGSEKAEAGRAAREEPWGQEPEMKTLTPEDAAPSSTAGPAAAPPRALRKSRTRAATQSSTKMPATPETIAPVESEAKSAKAEAVPPPAAKGSGKDQERVLNKRGTINPFD